MMAWIGRFQFIPYVVQYIPNLLSRRGFVWLFRIQRCKRCGDSKYADESDTILANKSTDIERATANPGMLSALCTSMPSAPICWEELLMVVGEIALPD